MNFLDLNYDVLFFIVSLLTSPEALPLTLVSRKIHSIAKRRSLSGVTVLSERQLAAVCEYMLDEPKSRLHYLRSFSVLWSPSKAYRNGVDDIIKKQFNGIKLLLEDPSARGVLRLALVDVEKTLACLPDIGGIIAMLPDLVELELQDVGARSLRLLHYLGSRPQKVVLRRICTFAQVVSIPPLFSPSSADPPAVSFEDPRFWTARSSVRHLELDTSDLPGPVFIDMFPNIRTLRLVKVPLMVAEQAAKWHQLTARWTKLDVLEIMDPRAYRMWLLRRPVRRVLLRSTFYQRNEDVVDAVRDTTPVVLVLNLEDFMGWGLWHGLSKGGQRMRMMQVTLRDRGEMSTRWTSQHMRYSLECWLEHIRGAFSASALVCICLHVVNREFGRDLLQIVSVFLARAVPSLRYVSVQVEEVLTRQGMHQQSLKAYWWQVVERNSKRIPLAIAAETGGRVAAHLDSEEFASTLQFDESLFPSAR